MHATRRESASCRMKQSVSSTVSWLRIVSLLHHRFTAWGLRQSRRPLSDRTQYIWALKIRFENPLFQKNEQIKRHKGIFISTAGLSWDNVFDAAFPIITAFFNTIGYEYYDNIIANEMDRYKGIRGHPTALKEAFEKGKEVVRVIESLKYEGEKRSGEVPKDFIPDKAMVHNVYITSLRIR